MFNQPTNHWREIIAQESNKDYFQLLQNFVETEYATHICYPPREQLFRALHLTDFDNTKVIILGQDPYHGAEQANGLSFAVNKTIVPPPSLRNILKEAKADVKIVQTHPDLIHWASQGVLLLNATLTVRANKAGSHQGKGWERFTDALIKQLAQKHQHLVFILWGSYAQKKATFINPTRHYILQGAHPSPLSAYRGFWGSKPFSKTNAYLERKGLAPISW